MNRGGPIVIIEDDLDDQEMFGDVFKDLECKNEIIFFGDGQQALEYLTGTDIDPFIIFSDINMPKLNGLKLKEEIQQNEDLRIKSIPYLFFTTSAEQGHVIEAYSKSVQGFFIKPSSYTQLKKIVSCVLEYWTNCESPNYVK